MNTFRDRRKHRRYKIKDDVFVVGESQIGSVRDISMGGIAFNYLNGSPGDSATIDIFCIERNFHVKEVPLRLITDDVEDSTPPYASIQMRRCAGEFSQLTAQHQQKLDLLMSNLAAENGKLISRSTDQSCSHEPS